MKVSELVRGASLRGSSAAFSETVSLRLGRAVATLLRRRGKDGPVLVARGSDGPELIVRDGLCQGLVLGGLEVVDLGRAESDLFTFALRHLGACGGALVGTTGGESVGVMLFADARPLVGEGLVDLARIADDGAFVVGSGTLRGEDLRAAFRTAPHHAERDSEAEA